MSNDVAVANIFSTKDYTLFVLHEFNREVGKIDVLIQSMKTHGFWKAKPLWVTPHRDGKRFVVKDGHHRLAAAQAVGIPVWYIVSTDEVDIPEIGMTEKHCRWSWDDCLVAYDRQGRSAYHAILVWKRETGLPVALVVGVLCGWGEYTQRYSDRFFLGNAELCKSGMLTMSALKNMIDDLEDINSEVVRNSSFIRAILRISSVDQFDIKTFQRKVHVSPFLFTKKATKRQYEEMINEIYNRGSRDKFPLVMMADQIMLGRHLRWFGKGRNENSAT